jgi:hypothetical protein
MAEPKKTQPARETLSVMAAPGKLIPKYATKIAVAKGGSNYILSFLTALPDEQAQMIERIVLDEGSVDQLIEALKGLKEAGNDK